MTEQVKVEVRWISGDRILLQVADRWHLVLSPLGAEDVACMLLACVKDSIQDVMTIEDASGDTWMRGET